MRKFKSKNLNKKPLILVLILCISIGFAMLTSNLNINGIFAFNSHTFNLHFDNIKMDAESISSVAPTLSNNRTNLNFDVTLSEPGDYYKFFFDVVNGGDVDAMIGNINVTGIPEELSDIVEYEVKYYNGMSLDQYQIIYPLQSLSMYCIVRYKDITVDQIPDIASTLNIELDIEYILPSSVGLKFRFHTYGNGLSIWGGRATSGRNGVEFDRTMYFGDSEGNLIDDVTKQTVVIPSDLNNVPVYIKESHATVGHKYLDEFIKKSNSQVYTVAVPKNWKSIDDFYDFVETLPQVYYRNGYNELGVYPEGGGDYKWISSFIDYYHNELGEYWTLELDDYCKSVSDEWDEYEMALADYEGEWEYYYEMLELYENDPDNYEEPVEPDIEEPVAPEGYNPDKCVQKGWTSVSDFYERLASPNYYERLREIAIYGYIDLRCTPTSKYVTYNMHYSDYSDRTKQRFDQGVAFNLQPNPWSVDGYTFKGWATTSNGPVAYTDGQEVTLNSNTELYAVWEKDS